jgi:hypothetical protein
LFISLEKEIYHNLKNDWDQEKENFYIKKIRILKKWLVAKFKKEENLKEN